jgi:hypothetical protein
METKLSVDQNLAMFVNVAGTAVVPPPNADCENMGDMIALNIAAHTHLIYAAAHVR